jgi:VWFA-related protein
MMPMHRTAALILLGAASLLPQGRTPPRVEPSEPAIRISADLVQVDAVVTDSKGRPVSGLTPTDFEILADGKRQPIARFSYITPERRTIVLIFDDCDSPLLSGSITQDYLRHFVGQCMRPGDSVSILPTSGTGDWQQLTSDGQRLYEAIGRVRPEPRAGSEYQRETAIREGRWPPTTDDSGHPLFHGLALFNALSSAVDGLAEIPGRKFVVVASEFLGWVQITQRSPAIRQLAGRANRAGVVIHVLHAGLSSPLPESPVGRVELVRAKGPDYLARATGGRSSDYPDLPPIGVHPLAYQRVQDKALVFLMKGLDGLVADMGGYYLIGYKPARLESGKNDSKLHSIKVNVRRSGLKVRSRNGYYGQPGQPVPAAPKTREELLQAALRSPFRGSAMRVRMTPFYSAAGKDPKTGRRRPTIRAMLAVDARDLRFEEQVDGTKKATVDAVAAVYGMGTQPVATNTTNCSISAPPGGPGDLATSSLLCGLDMTLDRPGPYVVRVAAMDRASEKLGTAYALAAVPNFDGDGLTLSTPVLTPLLREQVETTLPDERLESGITYEAPSSSATAGTSVAERAAPPRLALTGGNPVERVFAPGASIAYSFDMFGTVLDSGARKPALNFVLTVTGKPKQRRTKDPRNSFHFESPLMPIRIDSASSPAPVTGRIRLPADLEPGWYGMTLWVYNPADRLKPHGYEAMDFTVAKPNSADAAR